MARPHAWYSRRLTRHARLIVSKTGPRIAYRGRHGQVSPRSLFGRVGGFKLFSGKH
jgi:hypothetical protein